MKRWVGILFLGIGVGLSACSGDDGDDGDDDGGDGGGGSGGTGGGGSNTVKLHCVVEDAGQTSACIEQTVPEPALDATEEACVSSGGVVADECPTAGLIGKCSRLDGAAVYYFYEPDDPADVEESCGVLDGTWIPA